MARHRAAQQRGIVLPCRAAVRRAAPRPAPPARRTFGWRRAPRPRRSFASCWRHSCESLCAASWRARRLQSFRKLLHTATASIPYGHSLYHIWLQAPEGFRKRSSRPKAATNELHSRRTSDEDEPPPLPPLSLALVSAIAACLAHGNSVAPPCTVFVWHAWWMAHA